MQSLKYCSVIFALSTVFVNTLHVRIYLKGAVINLQCKKKNSEQSEYLGECTTHNQEKIAECESVQTQKTHFNARFISCETANFVQKFVKIFQR